MKLKKFEEKEDRKYIIKFVCTPDDCAKYLRSLLPYMPKEISSAPNMNNSNPDVIPNIAPVTYCIVPRDCIGGLPKGASMTYLDLDVQFHYIMVFRFKL